MDPQAVKDFILLGHFDASEDTDSELYFFLNQFLSLNYRQVLRCRQKHLVQSSTSIMLEVYFLRILLKPNFEKLIIDEKLEKDESLSALVYTTFFKRLSGTHIPDPINASCFDFFIENNSHNYLSFAFNNSQISLNDQSVINSFI